MLTPWHAPPIIVPPRLLLQDPGALHAPPMIVPRLKLQEPSSLHAPCMIVPLLFLQESSELDPHAPGSIVPAIDIVRYRGEMPFLCLDLCSHVRQLRFLTSGRGSIRCGGRAGRAGRGAGRVGGNAGLRPGAGEYPLTRVQIVASVGTVTRVILDHRIIWHVVARSWL